MRIRHVTPTGDTRTVDLFGTFDALARDEVVDFPALRPHQQAPWHAFLCQVAAMALLRAGTTELPDAAEGWRELLRGLTPDFPDDEPWTLVVDDMSKPALLQPPGMTVDHEGPKTKRIRTPDGLDMLVTARNHDVKGARIAQAQDDDWLFALVSLQTQDGMMGAGNPGASRMNGGYGSRVQVALHPAGGTPGSAFVRDVRALSHGMEDDPRLGLLWTVPWDGEKGVPFGMLHPLYVEIARKRRLVRDGDSTFAVAEPSKKPRVAAAERKGVTGDPWAPVLADGSKSWGVSKSGFGYRQITTLLDGSKVTLPPISTSQPADGRGATLVTRAVSRGQGKTEGYHERSIPVPAKAAGLLSGATDRIGATARARVKSVGEAADALRIALYVLDQGGPDKIDFQDKGTPLKIASHLKRFDRMVDAAFFGPEFWDATVVTDNEEALRLAKRWRERLRAFAEAVLSEAERSTPRSVTKRLRGVVRARATLGARMRRFVTGASDEAQRSQSPSEQGERA